MSLRADRFIGDTQQDVIKILDLIEEAQAIAAARLQEYNSIQDKATMAGEYAWPGAPDMTITEFSAGMAALANLAGILGDDAETLYKFKIEL